LLYRAGGIEFCDQCRAIRVEDLSLRRNAARRGRASRGVLPPWAVYRDGQIEGHLTFREEGYAHHETLAALRTRFGLELGMLNRPGRQRCDVAGELGFDRVISATRDESRAAAIRELVRQGRRVGYVGDPATNPETARAAHLTISIAPRPAADDRISAVWLLGPDYHKLIALRQLAAAGRAHSQVLTRFAVIPNVACIAGAFLLGFTSLAAVLVTNIGTYSIYCGNAGRLKRMERQLMARRNRFLRHQPGKFAGPVGQPILFGDEHRRG
jgi:cation transport ATPase